jgi:dTDP-4-amino-4,6-dideoxygalactose transaminase
MITTSRPDYAERIKLLRQHGMSVNDRVRHASKTLIFEDHLELGYNYRLTDIQASVGIKQLEKLDWIVEERRKIANRYLNELKDITSIRLPMEPKDSRVNFQSFSIYIKATAPLGRNELMERLLADGISTRRGVMTTHRETAYKDLGISLPISEDACDNSIVIPLFIPMTDSDISFVIERLKFYLG